jgi:hypothetical protein
MFEAPLSSGYAQTVLNLVRTTVPRKPVRYLVASHFHFDGGAGVPKLILIPGPAVAVEITQVAERNQWP